MEMFAYDDADGVAASHISGRGKQLERDTLLLKAVDE
jgi:hypothetical protein